MTNNTPFCPIYSDAIGVKSRDNTAIANTGLLFDKFPNMWRWKLDNTQRRIMNPLVPEFDKGVGRTKEGAGSWLTKLCQYPCGNIKLLREACDRQQRLTEAMGGRLLYITNTSRFATGLGRNHPMENGFTWHPTLGVPFLPGSSLKGLLRSWFREENDKLVMENGRERWEETDKAQRWFGIQKDVGRCIFLDMLPTVPPKLTVDIMTPHYGPYYQGEAAPGDWHSPVPISFLVVDERITWQLAILPGPEHRTIEVNELESLTESLTEALDIMGAGAKTAIGNGRFCPSSDQSIIDKRCQTGSKVERASGPRYTPKTVLKVERIEDPKGKGRLWFKADDGFGGTLVNIKSENVPDVTIGQTIELEVAAALQNGYNFRLPRKD